MIELSLFQHDQRSFGSFSQPNHFLPFSFSERQNYPISRSFLREKNILLCVVYFIYKTLLSFSINWNKSKCNLGTKGFVGNATFDSNMLSTSVIVLVFKETTQRFRDKKQSYISHCHRPDIYFWFCLPENHQTKEKQVHNTKC